MAFLLTATGARAATMFYIRGGGDGHGIGMSQYGSYGYALHGKHYRWILAHYYQGTQLGHTNPNRIVRVLLSTGSAAFSGATTADNKQLGAGRTYSVTANADGTLALRNQAGKKIGSFPAPLTVSADRPARPRGRRHATAARSSSAPTAQAGSRPWRRSGSTTTCGA